MIKDSIKSLLFFAQAYLCGTLIAWTLDKHFGFFPLCSFLVMIWECWLINKTTK